MLNASRMTLLKRALRLLRHILQTDSSGELSVKISRACSAETIRVWDVAVTASGGAIDVDVLSPLLWTYQRLSHFPSFQREAASTPTFLPSLVQWLARRYPPSTVASDALFDTLAEVAILGTLAARILLARAKRVSHGCACGGRGPPRPPSPRTCLLVP